MIASGAEHKLELHHLPSDRKMVPSADPDSGYGSQSAGSFGPMI